MDLKWIYTKDHKPTAEELNGKVFIYHRASRILDAFSIDHCNNYDTGFIERWYINCPDPIDRYIIIDIPEPEEEPLPCNVCGKMPSVFDCGEREWICRCVDDDHFFSVSAPTRAEAVAKWNKCMRGEAECQHQNGEGVR